VIEAPAPAPVAAAAVAAAVASVVAVEKSHHHHHLHRCPEMEIAAPVVLEDAKQQRSMTLKYWLVAAQSKSPGFRWLCALRACAALLKCPTAASRSPP